LKELRVQDFHVVELLKRVEGSALNYFCNGFDGPGIYDGPDACGSEFIRYARFHDAPDASEKSVGIAVLANEPRIMDRIRLDIHGHIIDQAFEDERFDDFGSAAVCIQFYGIAKRFDLFTQRKQAVSQGGLAAGNHHTVKEALSLFKVAKESLFIPSGLRRTLTLHQTRIMAVGAIEVAP
jgi:hypothetical protein